MNILLFAYTNFGVQCTDYVHRQTSHKLLVVTAPMDSGKHTAQWKSVILFCKEHRIPCIPVTGTQFTQAHADKIKHFSPDIIFSCYYPLIIPLSLLNTARWGALNFHGGLLPHYRGCLSGVWSILNGEDDSGVTLHFMDKGIDTGDIVEIRKVNILQSDTAVSLYEKVRLQAFRLFRKYLTGVQNVPRVKQDINTGRTYGRDLPHDGWIDWNWRSDYLCRFVRAMYFPPHLPARGVIRGRACAIRTCAPHPVNQRGYAPGSIIAESPKQLIVATTDAAVRCSEFYWEDK